MNELIQLLCVCKDSRICEFLDLSHFFLGVVMFYDTFKIKSTLPFLLSRSREFVMYRYGYRWFSM